VVLVLKVKTRTLWKTAPLYRSLFNGQSYHLSIIWKNIFNKIGLFGNEH